MSNMQYKQNEYEQIEEQELQIYYCIRYILLIRISNNKSIKYLIYYIIYHIQLYTFLNLIHISSISQSSFNISLITISYSYIHLILFIIYINMISILEIIEQITLTCFYTNQIIQRRLYANKFIIPIIKIFQFLIIIFLIIQYPLLQNPFSQNFTTILQNGIYLIYQFNTYNKDYIIASAALSFLFILLLINNKYKILSPNKKQVFQLFSCCLYVVFRLFYFSNIAQVLKMIRYTDVTKATYLLIIPIIFNLIYILIICKKDYYFGYFYPLIPIIYFSFESDTILNIFILILGLYIFYQNGIQNSCVCLKILLASVTFCLTQKITLKVGDHQLIIFAFGCLLFLIISIKGSLYFSVIQNKLIEIQYYWHYTLKKKQTKLSKSDQFLIAQIYMEQFYDSTNLQLQKIRQININCQNWNKNQHILLLQCQIKKFSNGSKSPEAQILQLRVKLEDDTKKIDTLLQIRQKYQNSKSNYGFFYRYQLYRLLIKLQNQYCKFKSESLYLDTIRSIDTQIQEFYRLINVASQQILEIWKQFSSHQVRFNIIQTKYSSILKMKFQIQNIYSRISQKSQAHAEKKILINFLQLLNWKSSQIYHKNSYNDLDNNLIQQIPFIIVKNNKILYPSYKFIQKFKYKRQQMTQNQILSIIPKNFQKIFSQLKAQSTGIKIQQSIQIILDGKGYFLLTKIQIYIVPDFQDGIKYIYFFDESESNNQQHFMLLYCLNTNIIQGANQAFIKEFNVDPIVFNASNSLITGQQVFYNFDFNSDANRKGLQTNDGVTCQLSLKSFKTRNHKGQRIKANIKILKKFEQKDTTRVVLRIQKNAKQINMKSFQGRILSYLQQQFIDVQQLLPQGKKQSQVQKYSDTFLNEVLEKKENLKRIQGNKSLIPIYIILIILLVGILSVIIAIYSTAVIRIYFFDFMMKQTKTINNRNNLLVDLFFNSFKIFHMNNWPPPELNQTQISSILASAKSQLNATIYNFQLNYVGNYQYQQFNPINYTLFFDNFNLMVNTNQTVLMDFVWASTLALNQSIVNFLINNFQIINIVQKQIQSLSLYFKDFNIYITMSVALIYIILSLILVLQIISNYYARKVQKGYEAVEGLYKFMPQQTTEKYLSQINQFMNIFQQTKQKKKKVPKQQQHDQAWMKKARDTFVSQKMILLRKDSGLKEQKIIKKSKRFLFLSLIKVLMIFGLVICYFFPISISLNSEKLQSPQILQVQHKLQSQYYQIKTSFLKVYYNMISKKINNKSYASNYDVRVINNFIALNKLLPNSFNNFIDQQWHYLNQDLCQNSKNLTRCNKIYNGILHSGMSQTMVVYEQNLNLLKNIDIIDCFKNNFFSDNLQAQVYIQYKMSQIINSFQKSQENYKNGILLLYNFYFGMGTLCISIIAFIFYFEYKFHSQRIQLCKSLFNLFPQTSLNAQETKKYVTQEFILQKLLQL